LLGEGTQARIRAHDQELINTLTTEFQTAQTIDFVWSHLPH
jgi:hypothetical protein